MLVIYHGGCSDGFCAAWLLNKAFPDAEFYPANHSHEPPDVQGQDVIIADFCYPKDQMEKICRDAKSLKVFDHHVTAKDTLAALNCEVFFDLNKSGGRLVWDYLSATLGNKLIAFDRNMPWIVAYTEDRDLWKFELPHSKAISAYLTSFPHDFEVWTELDFGASITGRWDSFVEGGNTILRYQEETIQRHVNRAKIMRFGPYEVPVVNATTLISEIGGRLCVGHPFAATYFDSPTHRVWSLRSDANGIDVAEFAKRSYGGGGHKHAAGFSVEL